VSDRAPPRAQPRAPIDWQAVKARLDRVDLALATDATLSAAAQAAILRQRALALARPGESEVPTARPCLNVLTVGCAGTRCGIDIAHAKEILSLTTLTPIPLAHPAVAGVMNRRGEVLLLLDLARLLGVKRAGIADLVKVIVVGPRGRELGLLVESVDGIAEIDPATLGPPIGEARFVLGLAPGDVVVIDHAALCEAVWPASGRPALLAQGAREFEVEI
jgi:purine-binding chemotaxis protein CheW